ncbi:DNA/RNA non-specific endonuclease [Azospirillum sp. TSO35-2]|uniref:DNA/RNA non-specific endonuclease n=1 Tax=Azospirillum sp. TSO35-2 TaxID=716796 RepID=UPI000D65D406|nr:DNA/RNA non-specific endonuclease [Azospirillum sp. TSO35-2]
MKAREERLRRYLDQITKPLGGLDPIVEQPIAVRRRTEILEGVAGLDGGMEESGQPLAILPAAPPGTDGRKSAVTAELFDAAQRGIQKLRDGRDPLSPDEMAGIEAIIIPDKRPALDIIGGRFAVTQAMWSHLTEDKAVHARLLAAIPCVGRVELPGQTRIPYGGTGFVVGDRLLMTNRHVAGIFAQGVGDRRITFRNGMSAGVDFLRERGRPTGPVLNVLRVRMIHLWWDMALLEVDGLPAGSDSLRLSVQDARDLAGREVAVIGYPAYDPLRNDPTVQDKIYDRTYGVKRLQPGLLAPGRDTASFGKLVRAAAHDCSTLGGASGSVVVDLETGEAIALHFGGRYLDINVAVPAFELARDGRVWDAGVRFAASRPEGAPPEWLRAWNDTEVSMPDAPPAGPALSRSTAAPPPDAPTSMPGATAPGGGRVTLEVPLRITIELGTPNPGAGATVSGTTAAASGAGDTERPVEPAHEEDFHTRNGYDPDFLGVTVPMPAPRDPSVLAPLKAGGTRLDYQNFSILMHAERRLALVTGSNITRDATLRQPEPGRDYSRKGLGGMTRNDSEKWFSDPRLDGRFQLSDAFFTKDRGAFDKGHIVRREDVTWGRTYDEVRRANGDTFHVTNCSPQVASFNRSGESVDNWGDLENLVQAESAAERLTVFAGPILDRGDETFVGVGDDRRVLRVKIPSRYWKLAVARKATGIAAYGFVLEQDLSAVDLEFVVPDNFRRYQVPLTAIEEATGIDFGETLRNADTYDSAVEMAHLGGLERTDSLVATEPAHRRPTPNGGDDAEAEPGSERRAPDDFTETAVRWRTARSLEALRRQIDARAPQRSKASDGTIGDAAHAARSSDHNPWVRDGAFGIVTAMDITHDPAGGCDAGALADAIVKRGDRRVKYVIWNRRIVNSSPIGSSPAWIWREYTGANPHNKHIHISVLPEKEMYDDETLWRI